MECIFAEPMMTYTSKFQNIFTISLLYVPSKEKYASRLDAVGDTYPLCIKPGSYRKP